MRPSGARGSCSKPAAAATPPATNDGGARLPMRNPPVTVSDQPLAERLRAATELLEWIAADRERLDELSTEDRERLHRAVADFYNPDPVARRRKIKEAERERMATRTERAGAVLQET